MDNIKDKLLESIKKYSKKNNIYIILIVGVIIMIAGSVFFDSNKETKVKNDNPASKSETLVSAEELESILSSIEGAGKVKVYLTYEDSGEMILARDEKDNITKSEESGVITKQEHEGSVKTVNSQGNLQSPIVTTQKEPKIQGVLIVASGAGNETVKNAIYKGTLAVLNVRAHKIEVLTMKK